MPITRARAGANSAYFLVPYVGTFYERSLTNEQWDQLPAGNLKSFLSRRFVDESGNADSVLFVEQLGEFGFKAKAYGVPNGALPTGLRISQGPSDPNYPLLPPGIVLLTLEGSEEPLVDPVPDRVVLVSVPYSASE